MYFVSNMAMGISSLILYDFPYPAHWLQICGWIFFMINITTFVFLLICMISSCWYYPNKLIQFHFDPSISPFMGCFVMGYITIVNFLWSLTKHLPSSALIIWSFWWLSVFMSIYTSFIIFFLTFITKQNNKLKFKDLNLTILLPIVTLTVSAVEGNLILPNLPSLRLKLLTIIVSIVMLSIAIGISFMIITINFARLFVHKLPATNLIFTSFLPIGLLGQATFGMVLLGKNFYTIILNSNVDDLSNYLKFFNYKDDLLQLRTILSNLFLIIFLIIAIFLLSIGYFMTFIAIMSVLSKSPPFTNKPNKKFIYSKFGNLKWFGGYWSMTFPLGTMSLGQHELYKVIGSSVGFFRVMATIYALGLFLVTLSCMMGVIYTIFKEVKSVWNYRVEKSDMV